MKNAGLKIWRGFPCHLIIVILQRSEREKRVLTQRGNTELHREEKKNNKKRNRRKKKWQQMD
jgi:hypothetical protein